MVIDNYNFKHNTLQNFQKACQGRKLVIIGDRDEIDFMEWNFLAQLGLNVDQYYYTDDAAYIDEQVQSIKRHVGDNPVVVLVASCHPFRVQRLLKESGFTTWYSTQLFMERYCFYNNTNVCHFYLDE